MSDDVIDRLDRIIFLMSLAFREQIAEARTNVLADAVSAAILTEAAEAEVSAGDLKRRVAAATKQSERTVSRRLTELSAAGWLRATGGGSNVKYRSTGV